MKKKAENKRDSEQDWNERRNGFTCQGVKSLILFIPHSLSYSASVGENKMKFIYFDVRMWQFECLWLSINRGKENTDQKEMRSDSSPDRPIWSAMNFSTKWNSKSQQIGPNIWYSFVACCRSIWVGRLNKKRLHKNVLVANTCAYQTTAEATATKIELYFFISFFFLVQLCDSSGECRRKKRNKAYFTCIFVGSIGGFCYIAPASNTSSENCNIGSRNFFFFFCCCCCCCLDFNFRSPSHSISFSLSVNRALWLPLPSFLLLFIVDI